MWFPGGGGGSLDLIFFRRGVIQNLDDGLKFQPPPPPPLIIKIVACILYFDHIYCTVPDNLYNVEFQYLTVYITHDYLNI